MTENNKQAMFSFFEEKIADCKKRMNELFADERSDEANFEKIRVSVYEIFKTILAVAVKSAKDDSVGIQQFFFMKVEQIPANWKEAYNIANQHEDSERMHIERIKLETSDEIRNMFTKIWGEMK